jgi:hypothetical protein
VALLLFFHLFGKKSTSANFSFHLRGEAAHFMFFHLFLFRILEKSNLAKLFFSLACKAALHHVLFNLSVWTVLKSTAVNYSFHLQEKQHFIMYLSVWTVIKTT